MTYTLTMESFIMKWEEGHMPPIPTLLVAFNCCSIFDIYQHYLEVIPSKFLVSTMITSKILISFAILAKISRLKGVWGNISTPYTSNFSYLIILLHFYHPPITLKQFVNYLCALDMIYHCNPSIFQHMRGRWAYEHGSISNVNQHGLKMLHTKFGAFITI